MPAFDNIRLPENIEQGAHGGAEFQTTIVTMTGGAEQRNIDWAFARAHWDIGYGIQSAIDFKLVHAFFYARRASGHGWRFKDWSDYQLTNEPIAIADGTSVAYQIIKTYEPLGPAPYIRNITRPVDGTSLAFDLNTNIYLVPNTVQVFINGSLQDATTYVVQPGGIINFTFTPAVNALIAVTCEFDIPVRFAVDHFDLSLDIYNAGVIQNLSILEVRESTSIFLSQNINLTAALALGLSEGVAIGFPPGSTTFDSGAGNFVTPNFNILTIEGWGPGSGGQCINPSSGNPINSAAAGTTTVSTFTLVANGGGATTGATSGSGSGGSGGTATGANTTNTTGISGGNPSTDTHLNPATFSGKGGGAPNGGGDVAGVNIASDGEVNGNDGSNPGGGGSGAAFAVGFSSFGPAPKAVWFAGGAGGGYFKHVYLIGGGGAPTVGSNIAYSVGAASVGANNGSHKAGDGRHGRVKFTWS